MSTIIKLSIIIVNYNTEKFIAECLNSVYAGNFPKSTLEIIIIDNASINGDIEVKRENWKNLSLIKNKRNLGFAQGNNLGINNAKGEYILLLNPDTVLPKDTLAKMLSFMEQNSKVGIATCKVELQNGSIDDACHRGFPTPWNSFCHFTGLSLLFSHSLTFNGYHLGYRNLDKIHEIDSCAGAFMMIRKKAGEQAGWLDVDYFWYGEDLDLCYRVKKIGWKIIYYPFTKILHYKGVSGGIKKHSAAFSLAGKDTKIRATKARFQAMRIFYDKHYKHRYPILIRFLIVLMTKIMEFIGLIKINFL